MMYAFSNRLVFVLAFILCCTSCQDKNSYPDLEELDMLSYGVPLKIKAPVDAEVEIDDLGIVQDITVQAGKDFNLQIIAGTAYLSSITEIVKKQKSDAMATGTFSKIVKEDDRGFIFEKKYSEERISYDFRYVRLQGDREFIFQTGLLGQFTLEDVEKMYHAVQ